MMNVCITSLVVREYHTCEKNIFCHCVITGSDSKLNIWGDGPIGTAVRPTAPVLRAMRKDRI